MLLRRRLSVLLAAAMMTLMVVVSAMPAFAGPKSQNSCGASNPNIGVPAGPPPIYTGFCARTACAA